MEDIIKQVIEIDNEAKNIIAEVEKNQKNIENYVEDEIKLKQSNVESEIRNILYEKQGVYDYELKKYKTKVNSKLASDLNKMEEKYYKEKNQIIEDAFRKIINKR